MMNVARLALPSIAQPSTRAVVDIASSSKSVRDPEEVIVHVGQLVQVPVIPAVNPARDPPKAEEASGVSGLKHPRSPSFSDEEDDVVPSQRCPCIESGVSELLSMVTDPTGPPLVEFVLASIAKMMDKSSPAPLGNIGSSRDDLRSIKAWTDFLARPSLIIASNDPVLGSSHSPISSYVAPLYHLRLVL